MGKQKLYRYATVGTFSNVVELNPKFKGSWAKEFFGNSQPITLELACGKGHYVLALAEKHPDQNFIGVDIKGERLFVGARKGQEVGLRNAGFLRTQIEDLAQYFEPGEVHEIWITFPDPYLRKPEKRLTSPRFLAIYRQLLIPGGVIHLKTDSPELEESTLSVLYKQGITPLQHLPDIYATLPDPLRSVSLLPDSLPSNHLLSDSLLSDSLLSDALTPDSSPLYIQTHYERLHLKEGRTIRYIAFCLDQSSLL